MPLIRFFRRALSHAASALLAATLVASCETAVGSGSSSPPSARSAATAADVGVERVILQAYRAIGDRHLYDPDFRKMSAETYRGFASTDPLLSLQAGDKAFTITRDGREVVSRPAPADTTDGRAWGGLLAELFAASVNASPVLQQSDRQVLIKGAMTATTKLLDRNSRYADPDEARDNRFQRDGGGGVGITVERTEDKKVMIRAVQEDSPASRGGIRAGDQIVAIDGEPMVEKTLSDVVHRLRGTVGAPVSLTVARASGPEFTAALKRGRVIPTTVMYERRGNVALIHLMGFNSATTDTLRQSVDKARAEIGRDIAGIIVDTYRSSSRRTVALPMVVLVNGNSASAAEIVAAALQDRGRAVVVGTTSYGKGTVQTVVRLPNEGELVLTWSRLLAPSGYTWNELGVLPNICTAKVADVGKLALETVDANRSTLRRWHAERNPSQQEVMDLRKICPPGDETPDRDVDIAARLLRDPTLYAHAVRLGSIDQAQRH